MWYWCTGLSVGLSLLRLVFVRPPCPVRGGVMSKFWGLRMVLFVGWWVYVLLRWLLGGMNLIFLAQEYGGILTPVVIGILIKGWGWEYHDSRCFHFELSEANGEHMLSRFESFQWGWGPFFHICSTKVFCVECFFSSIHKDSIKAGYDYKKHRICLFAVYSIQ